MRLPQGLCHLCGKKRVLTYEHVPASSSFNAEPVEMFGLEHWLRRGPEDEMVGGETKERGAGAHTLCADCNSATGGEFVPELKEWTTRGMAAIRDLAGRGDVRGNALHVTLHGVYPGRFLRQVITMLASVNSPGFLNSHAELRDFVLNRDANTLSSRYNLYLAMTHPKSHVFRLAGLAPLIRSGIWCVTWVTDLVWPPFAYIMTIDEPAPMFGIGNINVFARFGNRRVDIPLELPFLIGEQPYPGEYSDPEHPHQDVKQYPSLSSARVPFVCDLSSGEQRSGEIAFPKALDEWTGEDLREFGQGLLRLLCVDKGQPYEFLIRWEGSSVMIRIRADRGVVQVVDQPIPPDAIRVFIGHDGELPRKGQSGFQDTLREGLSTS